MQSAKLTSTRWRGDIGRFPAGEDLINAEKQTGSVRWRGCCGVRTVATLDTSSCRKETELWKKSKQEPWTGLFNPAVNPRPFFPTTSHYLCTTFSPRTAERTRTRCIVWRLFGRGGGGAARAAACCSWRGQKNENHRVHRAITKKKKKSWTDGLYSLSTGRENIADLKKQPDIKWYFYFCYYFYLISFDVRMNRASSQYQLNWTDKNKIK